MANVIRSSLTSLPLYRLIAAPLTAAIQGQAKAAMNSAEFIRSVGFDESNNAVVVEFNYEKTTEEGAATNVSLKVPFLTLINVPFIRIQEMTIDFEFTVHKSVTKDTTTTKNASLNYSGGVDVLFYKTDLELEASYSKERSVSSSLDKTATFKMSVRAGSDDIPAGLAEMLDLLKETVKETESTS